MRIFIFFWSLFYVDDKDCAETVWGQENNHPNNDYPVEIRNCFEIRKWCTKTEKCGGFPKLQQWKIVTLLPPVASLKAIKFLYWLSFSKKIELKLFVIIFVFVIISIVPYYNHTFLSEWQSSPRWLITLIAIYNSERESHHYYLVIFKRTN